MEDASIVLGLLNNNLGTTEGLHYPLVLSLQDVSQTGGFTVLTGGYALRTPMLSIKLVHDPLTMNVGTTEGFPYPLVLSLQDVSQTGGFALLTGRFAVRTPALSIAQ